MNRDALRQVLATVEARLDRRTVARFASVPVDPRARALFERERWGPRVPPECPGDNPERPTLLDVGSALWEAAKRRDPSAIVWEPADGRDSGGPELGGRWLAASECVMQASLAYAYPELFTPDERRTLTRGWVAVFGPLPGARA